MSSGRPTNQAVSPMPNFQPKPSFHPAPRQPSLRLPHGACDAHCHVFGPVGIAAPSRHPLLPDVRTLDEQGIHGVDSNNWYALFAPAKTRGTRIDDLNAAVRRVLTTESYRKRLLDSGAEPMPSSPGELAALVKADTAKWGRIIRDKKIKGE
jgi:hypothetical protein